MKSKTTGYGSISTVFSNIVLLCVSSMKIIIILKVIKIMNVNQIKMTHKYILLRNVLVLIWSRSRCPNQNESDLDN